MHSKLKGNIAFTSVILELQKNGFNVFTENGDYSKIDIIAEKNKKIKTIQVKWSGTNKEVAILHLKKSGPNGYRYTYDNKDIDWFVIYHPYTEKLVWVKSEVACQSKNEFWIRIIPTKSGQDKNINDLDDFSIKNFLKDFE